jgi:hypothetical protein
MPVWQGQYVCCGLLSRFIINDETDRAAAHLVMTLPNNGGWYLHAGEKIRLMGSHDELACISRPVQEHAL